MTTGVKGKILNEEYWVFYQKYQTYPGFDICLFFSVMYKLKVASVETE